MSPSAVFFTWCLLPFMSPSLALPHSSNTLDDNTPTNTENTDSSNLGSRFVVPLSTTTTEARTNHQVKASIEETQGTVHNFNGTAIATPLVKLKHKIISLNQHRVVQTDFDITDPYRPLYHFTPESKWMNDPNGLIFYQGYYHLFYQHNPYGTVWGHMHWAHARSKDLLHWQHLPIALFEENDIMIYSGSAVADRHNTSGLQASADVVPLIAIYAGDLKGGLGHHEDQNIAVSNDGGFTFTKYERNPVLDIGMANFRDPKVFWYENELGEGYWLMAVALSELHMIAFYKSDNLINWTELSRFGPMAAVGGDWECPDLFELDILSHHPSHPQAKPTGRKAWVLLVNINPGGIQGGNGMQYFMGQFDGVKFTPFDQQERWLDWGKDFYAAVTYNDVPDDRRIIHGWLGNWIYGKETLMTPTGEYKWRGELTIPRVLQLHAVNESSTPHLFQKPIQELVSLRHKQFSLDEATIVKQGETDLIYSMLGFEGGMTFEFHTVMRVVEELPAHLEFHIRSTADQSESLVFGVQVNSTYIENDVNCDWNKGNVVYSDRSHAGLVDWNLDFSTVQRACLPLLNGNVIELRLYVDRSSLEAFIADGQLTMTESHFPSTNKQNDWFFMEVVEGQVEVLEMQLWEQKLVPVQDVDKQQHNDSQTINHQAQSDE